jgi:single-strand DNA-binding protein
MNIAILMGRLTTDVDYRTSQSGKGIVKFTLAVDREFTKQGEERQADFISCTAFGATADFISKYFTKGRMICVRGSQQTGSYNDKKYPDVKHYTNTTIIDKVWFTGEKKADNTPAAYGVNPQAQQIPQQSAQADLAIGNLNEFEEIIGDGHLPF